MSKSREQVQEYLKEINIDGKRVLDIGVQDKPAKMFTKGTPKEYFTMDIDNQWKPDIVGDLNKDYLEWVSRQGVGINFDTIFCLETMEHIWNPIQALKNIEKLLATNGTAYFSTPFINPIHDTHDMLRYTDEWYEKAGLHVGFKHITVKERVATLGLDDLLQFFKKEGLRMSKIRLRNGEGHKIRVIGYFVEMKK